MTTQRSDQDPPRPPERGVSTLAVVAALGIVVVLGAVGIWYFLIRDDSAASVDSDAAAAARDEALAEVADGDGTSADDTAAEDTAADTSPEDTATASAPSGEGEPTGIEGTWTVDTSIGTFDEACLTDVCDATFAGFRIDEELASIGAKTVVGRSPGVSGTMVVEGTSIVSTDLVVDMTELVTDSGARTNAIRSQAIETDAFPEATFTLTAPIELGAVPADGEAVQVEATGDLTVHGVTRSVTIPLEAELAGDVVVVFGSLGPFPLADHDIAKPTAAVVLSVEDEAIMELQVFFRRG